MKKKTIKRFVLCPVSPFLFSWFWNVEEVADDGFGIRAWRKWGVNWSAGERAFEEVKGEKESEDIEIEERGHDGGK